MLFKSAYNILLSYSSPRTRYTIHSSCIRFDSHGSRQQTSAASPFSLAIHQDDQRPELYLYYFHWGGQWSVAPHLSDKDMQLHGCSFQV